MTTTYTEGAYTGECIVKSEEYSFDQVTVLSGQNLLAGTVVGRVQYGIGGIVAALTGAGNGTMTAISCGPEVEVGAYLVDCTAAATHGGTFSVTSPSGKVLPSCVLSAGAGNATVYTSRHINFTITDGSSDFTTASLFTVTVSATMPVVVGATGTGTMTLLALGPDAIPGSYKVNCVEAIANGGRFEIIAPNGMSLGTNFIMGTGSTETAAFATRHISFSITDATDFIVTNYFTVVVWNEWAGTDGKGKIVAWDPTPAAWDGRHRVAGVTPGAINATSADTVGVMLARRGVVNDGELAWLTGLTAGEKASGKAELLARDIVVATTI